MCAQCVDLPFTDTEHLSWNVPFRHSSGLVHLTPGTVSFLLPTFPIGLPVLYGLRNPQTPLSQRPSPPATTGQ